MIRLLIMDSQPDDIPTTFAFKSCVQTLLAYNQSSNQKKSFSLNNMLTHIASCKLLKRPPRVEPRVVKRRPKPFKLMMKPREELRAKLLA